MSETKRERQTYEGWEPELRNSADVRQALAIALDYRGDITVTSKDGKETTGFLFSCEPDAPEPYFLFYPKGEDAPRKVPYHTVTGLKFSTIDPAAGRSWTSWVAKHAAKKKAQAEGQDIGDIEPELMSLND